MSDMLELAKRIAERAGKNAKVAPELLYAPILWELQDDARSSAVSAQSSETLKLADKIASFAPRDGKPIVLIARERRLIEDALRRTEPQASADRDGFDKEDFADDGAYLARFSTAPTEPQASADSRAFYEGCSREYLIEQAIGLTAALEESRQEVAGLMHSTRTEPQSAPKLEALESCKGEQLKFEEWAAAEKYDMHEHPLHYLFMDDKTNAARQGWKAALRYATTAIAGAHSQAESVQHRYDQDGQACPTCGRVGNGEG